MVRVTIELLPHGSELHKRHLGTMEIANDGTAGNGPVGSYNVKLSKRGRPNVLWRRGRVERFPRHALGAYDLLFRALAAVIGSRGSGDVTICCAETNRLDEFPVGSRSI